MFQRGGQLPTLVVVLAGFILGAVIFDHGLDSSGGGRGTSPASPEARLSLEPLAVHSALQHVPHPVPSVPVQSNPAANEGDPLSRLLSQVQEDGIVVATTTDLGYLTLTVNWICHLKKLGLDTKVVVFALDEGIHKEMLARGIPSYYEAAMKKSSDTVGNWNSKSYNQVVHTKTKHQMAVLERGYDLLFADVDIPWTSDMRTQVVREARGVDFLGQQNWPQNDMNTGFMYIRSNPRMITFFQSVLGLEANLEGGAIRIGFDPRHDIFNPSDDQSSIAFTLLCGKPTGQYPGRGDEGTPQGGMVPANKMIVVQSKWQKGLLHRRHAMRPSQVQSTEHRRTFHADCTDYSGINITYALLPPKHYQTGHKSFKGFKIDALLTNTSAMYHPNFMKGSDNKVEALKLYARWLIADATSPALQCSANT